MTALLAVECTISFAHLKQFLAVRWFIQVELFVFDAADEALGKAAHHPVGIHGIVKASLISYTP
jgi:hypothetical protein